MNVAELHFEFRLLYDKLGQGKDFNEAEIDWFLNKAQLSLIQKKISGNNPSKRGLDDAQKRIKDLSTIAVKYPAQQPITSLIYHNEGTYKVYECVIGSNFRKKPLHFTQLIARTDCNRRMFVKFIDSAFLEETIRNPLFLDGENLVGTLGMPSNSNEKSAIFIYSKYTITALLAEYIKYPEPISLGTYAYITGETRAAKSSELPDEIHTELVAEAVIIATASLMDSLDVKALMQQQSE